MTASCVSRRLLWVERRSCESPFSRPNRATRISTPQVRSCQGPVGQTPDAEPEAGLGGDTGEAEAGTRRAPTRAHDRKRRLYSNGRTTLAAILEACGCRGLRSAADSSGTMTDGTSRIAERRDESQSEPSLTLARPAGIAAHVAGIATGSTSSRRAHTRSSRSMATRNQFNGNPASSMCAAGSSTRPRADSVDAGHAEILQLQTIAAG